MVAIKAALFDLGGVILESPLSFISEYERSRGIEPNLVRALVGGYAHEAGPWQALERGELSLEAFCERFDQKVRERGGSLSTLEMMRAMNQHTVIRPAMLAAVRRVRAAGFTVGALTNNWITDDEQDERLDALRGEFHVFIESCKVRMRKPEKRIFERACEELEVAAEAIVFLDDIGQNLKVARALGMTTIKVDDPRVALDELGGLVGLPLTGEDPSG
jgi:putative hydrolase of the HAD superfamily